MTASFEDKIAEATAAIQGAEPAKAELLLREILEVEPNHVSARYWLGQSLIAQGRVQEAKQIYLKLIISVGLSSESLTALSSTQYILNEYKNCESTLEILIRTYPESLPFFYRRLAKIKVAFGKVSAACDVLAQAYRQHPDDIEILAAHAAILSDEDTEAACRLLESGLDAPHVSLAHKSFILKRALVFRGLQYRRMLSLPETAISWPDACGWVDRTSLRNLVKSLNSELPHPGLRIGVLLDFACAAICRQDWSAAEQYLAHVRQDHLGTFADVTTFDPAFFATLEQMDEGAILTDLPPLVTLLNAESGGAPWLYVACDPIYCRKFTLTFLKSLETKSPGAAVHIHLLDGEPSGWADLVAEVGQFKNLRIGMTAEASGVSKADHARTRYYFHAVRFVRLYQFIQAKRQAAWLLDADVFLAADPAETLLKIQSADLAICALPGGFEPHLRILGGCVGMAPTPRGLEFAKLTAAYIMHWLRTERYFWGTDQVAMLAVYAHLVTQGRETNTLFLHHDTVGLNKDGSGIFRFPTGINKYFSAEADAEVAS